MSEISFDFQKYIRERKGLDAAMAKTGAAYAYPGDQKVLRALAHVTPVTLAVEATVRLWKRMTQSEILGTAVKVSSACSRTVPPAPAKAASPKSKP